MYTSDNNNLHDVGIEANQILNLIESLGDEKLTEFFKQMDYTEEEKLLYVYKKLILIPEYDKDGKLLPVSETDQLDAVNQNGNTIQYIQNPSEDVQLAAVNNNGYAIRYIENPSEKIKQLARDKGIKNV